jgi:hypothetical protein
MRRRRPPRRRGAGAAFRSEEAGRAVAPVPSPRAARAKRNGPDLAIGAVRIRSGPAERPGGHWVSQSSTRRFLAGALASSSQATGAT